MARRGRQGEMPADVSAPLALPAEARLDLERTLTALGELPDELREPLVLYAQGGLSYEEIAAQLEITLAAVKIRIFRARQKLESYR